MYDWRELQRWNISEARLPPRSIVRVHESTLWERYGWLVISAFTALTFHAALIMRLLLERRSRRGAEVESRRRSLEVMHLSRTAEAGALSASFAHELSQPPTSIMLSAEEGGRVVGAEPPNFSRAKEILSDIWQTGQHAAEIISRVKKLLKRRSEVEAQVINLNEAIADAIQILSSEAKQRRVKLAIASTCRCNPPATGDIELGEERHGRDDQHSSRSSQDCHSNGAAGRIDSGGVGT